MTFSPYSDSLSLGLRIFSLTQPLPISRRLILQQARGQILKSSHCLSADGFMFYFTPQRGFFSPFPRGTISLSVIQEYLALRGGPRWFTRDFTCPMLLGIWLCNFFRFQLRDFHPLWCRIQLLRLILVKLFEFLQISLPTTPIQRIGLGCSSFARRY